MKKQWKYKKAKKIADYKIFNVYETNARSPRDEKEYTFYTLQSKDWVDVIAHTPSGEVVMVKQVRHGTRRYSLELPAGIVDSDEDAVSAGLRELREETGYEAKQATYLGFVHPNPAFMNNRCHVVEIDERKEITAAQKLDDSEDVSVVLVPLSRVPSLIRTGKITSALTIAAFTVYFAHKQKIKASGI